MRNLLGFLGILFIPTVSVLSQTEPDIAAVIAPLSSTDLVMVGRLNNNFGVYTLQPQGNNYSVQDSISLNGASWVDVFNSLVYVGDSDLGTVNTYSTTLQSPVTLFSGVGDISSFAIKSATEIAGTSFDEGHLWLATNNGGWQVQNLDVNLKGAIQVIWANLDNDADLELVALGHESHVVRFFDFSGTSWSTLSSFQFEHPTAVASFEDTGVHTYVALTSYVNGDVWVLRFDRTIAFDPDQVKSTLLTNRLEGCSALQFYDDEIDSEDAVFLVASGFSQARVWGHKLTLGAHLWTGEYQETEPSYISSGALIEDTSSTPLSVRSGRTMALTGTSTQQLVFSDVNGVSSYLVFRADITGGIPVVVQQQP